MSKAFPICALRFRIPIAEKLSMRKFEHRLMKKAQSVAFLAGGRQSAGLSPCPLSFYLRRDPEDKFLNGRFLASKSKRRPLSLNRRVRIVPSHVHRLSHVCPYPLLRDIVLVGNALDDVRRALQFFFSVHSVRLLVSISANEERYILKKHVFLIAYILYDRIRSKYVGTRRGGIKISLCLEIPHRDSFFIWRLHQS